MKTDLANVYISRILNMKVIDKNTGEVVDEWDFERCKNLEISAEVALNFSDYNERVDINGTN